MMKSCGHDHAYPVCACSLGYKGTQLLVESRRLSSLAGWPNAVRPGDAARVLAMETARRRKANEMPPRKAGGCNCGRA